MPSPSRRQPDRTERNREIDALDLSAGLEVLPAAADPAFSPLSQVGRPVEPDLPPARIPATTGPVGRSRPEPTPINRGSRRNRTPEPAVEAVRSERDQIRDRLVRDALQARGLDPDTITRKPPPRGGKHRPTIELTPEEYAAIQIATAVRPDLFGRSLVSFIRTCADNWEAFAQALDADGAVGK
ncbi:MAG: hypothetical protein ACFCVK_24870 [Acidimicrobiales bacterium]